MRVSLIIDGDSSGGVKAAEEQSRAISDLSKESEAVAKAIEAGFGRAIGSIEKMADANKKNSAANDNAAGTAVSLTQKIGDLTSKIVGSESAFGKAAAGAGGFANSIAGLLRSAGPVGILSAAIGVASVAISTFYQVSESGAARAAQRLDEQARLIGVVQRAYNDGAKAAANFGEQSKKVTELQLKLNLIGLRGDLADASSKAVGGFQQNYAIAGLNQLNNPFSDGSETRDFAALKATVDAFNASIKAGSPDVKTYQDRLAAIGLAAEKTNPELAKTVGQLLDDSKTANNVSNKITQTNDALAVLNGTATTAQAKNVGIAKTAADASNEYERLAKSLGKQAAAQEAEALTVGKSAGEAAKLRVQYLLNEAAAQSGAGATAKYAKEIENLASRFGSAAQAAAEASLKSNALFDRGQLGRTALEGNVAAQLRTVYGDDVEGQLNGALATSLRFNESMRDLKSTTMDLASGAFRDIRMEIQAGKTGFDALGAAGVNAFNKIIDKAGDKALDSLISKLFGAASGDASGGIIGSLGKLLGFSEGGYTGPGGRHEAAGIVHKGEVVWSQGDISRHGGVAVVEAMRRGVPGYAGGGVVGGAPSPRVYLNAASGSGSQPTAPMRVQVEIVASVDDDGKLAVIAREAGRDGASDAVDLRITSFSRHELPERVQQIQQNPRNR